VQIEGVNVTLGDALHIAEIVAIVCGGFTVAFKLGRTHQAITAAIEKQDAAAERLLVHVEAILLHRQRGEHVAELFDLGLQF
jgi:hypothetical protein